MLKKTEALIYDVFTYIGKPPSIELSNTCIVFMNVNIETSELYEKLEWHCCKENETKIMSSYREVIEWCLFNNFYPVLLFYMYSDKDKIKEPKNIEFTQEQINKF